MNNRRKLVIVLGACALPAPFRLFAQPQSKAWRVGFLGRETAAGYVRELEAFRAGLKDFGYVEGKNLVIEYRWAESVDERLPQLAAELLREKVDILVTHSAPGVRAALRVTTTVPIVVASMAGDPVTAGFAKSLARPGGNITGSISLSQTVNVKQLELVKDALPRARKVEYLATPTALGETEKGMETAARSLKLDFLLVPVGSVNDFESAIAGMAERRVDVIIVSNQPLFFANVGRIAALAAHQRIPALGSVDFADGGGLIGYGTDIRNRFRRAAYFVDRIFKGAKPGDLPIEQPTKLKMLQGAGEKAGLYLLSIGVRSWTEIESAFPRMVKERTQALYISSGGLFITYRRELAELASKMRLPSIYETAPFAESGGLMSYGQNSADSNRRAAIFVDKIFRGTNPADLPVEQPMTFELVVNMKTAKSLGLTMPPEIMVQARRVIE